MDCSEFEASIAAYHDGEIPDGLATRYRLHVESCGRCAEQLRELQGLDAALRSWPLPAKRRARSLEDAVMTAVAARSPSPILRSWVLAAAASIAAIAVGAWILQRPAKTELARVPQSGNTTIVEGTQPSPPLRKLSAPEEADARTLYYRGMELVRNGKSDDALALFTELQHRYPGSGLAASSSYQEAILLEQALSPEAMDAPELRQRLSVWENIRQDVLGEQEIERTMFYRAKLSYLLCERTRDTSERERARHHARAYLEGYPHAGAAAAVQRWVDLLR